MTETNLLQKSLPFQLIGPIKTDKDLLAILSRHPDYTEILIRTTTYKKLNLAEGSIEASKITQLERNFPADYIGIVKENKYVADEPTPTNID